ncbi:MAG TPA: hypothetical protein VGW38_26405, partial [Chloroflexota bacterium]|nr:hypothetical protein [Chloroflexota bacterium]
VWVGIEEVLHTHGVPLRVWYPLCPGMPRKIGVSSPEGRRRAIAHSAREAGEAETADVVRHVSFALAAASHRLRDLSDAYASQLQHALANGTQHGDKFTNLGTFDLYLACHSFLVEACSARDYLARFLAKHVYGGVAADSVAQLLKRYKDALPGHPVQELLKKANDRKSPDAWMVRLNEYRDIITHRAPISYLGLHSYIRLQVRQVNTDLSIPRAVFEVPDDPFAQGRSSFCDALDLFRRYHGKLMEFADFLVAYSPYPPSHLVVKESDIINLQRLPVVNTR